MLLFFSSQAIGSHSSTVENDAQAEDVIYRFRHTGYTLLALIGPPVGWRWFGGVSLWRLGYTVLRSAIR